LEAEESSSSSIRFPASRSADFAAVLRFRADAGLGIGETLLWRPIHLQFQRAGPYISRARHAIVGYCR
jgi:hypothetical protein